MKTSNNSSSSLTMTISEYMDLTENRQYRATTWIDVDAFECFTISRFNGLLQKRGKLQVFKSSDTFSIDESARNISIGDEGLVCHFTDIIRS